MKFRCFWGLGISDWEELCTWPLCPSIMLSSRYIPGSGIASCRSCTFSTWLNASSIIILTPQLLPESHGRACAVSTQAKTLIHSTALHTSYVIREQHGHVICTCVAWLHEALYACARWSLEVSRSTHSLPLLHISFWQGCSLTHLSYPSQIKLSKWVLLYLVVCSRTQ